MVSGDAFKGVITFLIICGALIVGVIWGIWELIDWLWIDDAIRTSTPMIPELEITMIDNVIDTVYVYRKP